MSSSVSASATARAPARLTSSCLALWQFPLSSCAIASEAAATLDRDGALALVFFRGILFVQHARQESGPALLGANPHCPCGGSCARDLPVRRERGGQRRSRGRQRPAPRAAVRARRPPQRAGAPRSQAMSILGNSEQKRIGGRAVGAGFGQVVRALCLALSTTAQTSKRAAHLT